MNQAKKQLCIYKISNTVNNKVYIGQTNYPELRWSQHRYSATHLEARNSQVISRALAKHGVENFKFEIIAGAKTREALNQLEEELIRQYDSRNPERGYNIDYGGGVEARAPEIGEKISKSLKAYYKIHGFPLKGRKHSEESKRKMSESSMGKAGTNTGKTFDDAWRSKISESRVGGSNKSLRRFSDDQEKEICRLYVEEEKSTYALGKEFDCSRTTIHNILIRCGVSIRQSNYTGHSNGRNIFTIEQEKEICGLYQGSRETMASLARKFGCNRMTIREILLRAKIDLKTRKSIINVIL